MTHLIRRNPRTERIARNRLHPLHSTLQLGVEQRGPTGLLRRNPHQQGFTGPNGLKRIDRLRGNAATQGRSAQAATAQAEAPLPLHTVAHPERYIVVVPDMIGGRLNSHDKDVLGLAQQLAMAMDVPTAVVALCFSECKETQFDLAGVDRLILLQDAIYDGYAPEARLAALTQVEHILAPQHWLFPDSVHGGADLGLRLAAHLQLRPAVNAWQVKADMTVSRAASASQDIHRETPRIILLQSECASPVDETRHAAQALDIVSITLAPRRLQDAGPVAVDPAEIPLTEAPFILSAGNGIHNWPQFHSVAKALGATEGASRVAVDDGHMPRSRQVGATGSWVTARVYIAVGISGAIQHMQGIGQCDKVIAINTDAGCDMVKRAALSTIGDSEAILAALLTLLQNHHAAQQQGETHAA